MRLVTELINLYTYLELAEVHQRVCMTPQQGTDLENESRKRLKEFE